MKKILLMTFGAMLSASVISQIFTDNFDSYSVGQGLVAQNPTDWDTWTPSAANEDVLVSDANASSGANSLYFSSSSSNLSLLSLSECIGLILSSIIKSIEDSSSSSKLES